MRSVAFRWALQSGHSCLHGRVVCGRIELIKTLQDKTQAGPENEPHPFSCCKLTEDGLLVYHPAHLNLAARNLASYGGQLFHSRNALYILISGPTQLFVQHKNQYVPSVNALLNTFATEPVATTCDTGLFDT